MLLALGDQAALVAKLVALLVFQCLVSTVIFPISHSQLSLSNSASWSLEILMSLILISFPAGF